MKKVLVIGAIVVLIVVIIIVSVFYGKEGEGKEVYTFKVEKGDIISAVSASGSIEPKIKVNISANVLGEIKELAVKEGTLVKKGDFLLQIDKERYLSEVQKLEAYQRMSRIAVERERVNLQNIENDLRRMKALYEDKIVSDEQLEGAQLKYDTQKIHLKSLDEQVAQAEADLLKAKDELKKTRIISPMDGKVTQLNNEVGEQVLMGTTNIPGTVIMVISDMSEVRADVAVDETEIISVGKDQKAEITVDAVGEKHKYEGQVEEIGNTAQKLSEANSFAVKIRIADPDERLKPGMTARAKIETERKNDVVKVPIQAVVQRDIEKEKEKAKEKAKKGKASKKEKEQKAGQNGEKAKKENEKGNKKEKEKEAVYLMVNGKATLTPVESGLNDEFYVEIKSGLKEGDIVVTGPYRTLKNLKEGDKIKEKKEKEGEKEEGKESAVEVKVED